MARHRSSLVVDAEKARQDQELLEAMATDVAGDDRSRKRAQLILAMAGGADLAVAAADLGMGVATARAKVREFNAAGWTALLTIQAPRGGDFLARYDLGFWAERLTRVCLDQSKDYRAIPYGTSRSEPFTDIEAFRQYRQTEFQLQAWETRKGDLTPGLLFLAQSSRRLPGKIVRNALCLRWLLVSEIPRATFPGGPPCQPTLFHTKQSLNWPRG